MHKFSQCVECEIWIMVEHGVLVVVLINPISEICILGWLEIESMNIFNIFNQLFEHFDLRCFILDVFVSVFDDDVTFM